ncbi:hypothetical protein ASG33_05460 [Dyadobacter sp. Leaf189]|nr:hypothetical protein ASG33_05460 [Dyadobacter sp. Leaf189]
MSALFLVIRVHNILESEKIISILFQLFDPDKLGKYNSFWGMLILMCAAAPKCFHNFLTCT